MCRKRWVLLVLGLSCARGLTGQDLPRLQARADSLAREWRHATAVADAIDSLERARVFVRHGSSRSASLAGRTGAALDPRRPGAGGRLRATGDGALRGVTALPDRGHRRVPRCPRSLRAWRSRGALVSERARAALSPEDLHPVLFRSRRAAANAPGVRRGERLRVYRAAAVSPARRTAAAPEL